MDDATIMAFVDGELDGPARRAVETAMATDADLRGRVEQERALRRAVSEAFGGIVDEPVPLRLSRAVLRGGGGSLRPPPRVGRWAALAASLVVGVACGVAAGRGSAPAGLVAERGGEMRAAGPLAKALDRQLAEDAGGAIRIGLSFRDGGGRYCRTFQTRSDKALAGLACHDAGVWRVQAAVAAGAPAASPGYRTASSETPPLLLQAVEDSIRGEPLTADEETAARAAGWRSGR